MSGRSFITKNENVKEEGVHREMHREDEDVVDDVPSHLHHSSTQSVTHIITVMGFNGRDISVVVEGCHLAKPLTTTFISLWQVLDKCLEGLWWKISYLV